jgi:hypothetical protein
MWWLFELTYDRIVMFYISSALFHPKLFMTDEDTDFCTAQLPLGIKGESQKSGNVTTLTVCSSLYYAGIMNQLLIIPCPKLG